jgi:hypothetical protein
VKDYTLNWKVLGEIRKGLFGEYPALKRVGGPLECSGPFIVVAFQKELVVFKIVPAQL